MVAMTLSKHLDGFIDEVTLKDSVRGAIGYRVPPMFLPVSLQCLFSGLYIPLDELVNP